MSTGPIREIRAISATTLLCAVVCLFLAVAPAAQAAGMTADPMTPVVNETVNFTGPASECPAGAPLHYTYTVTEHHSGGPDTTTGPTDTPGTPPGGKNFSTSFANADPYTVSEDAYCGDSHVSSGSVDLTVRQGLGGSISVSPDPPVRNQAATLEAAATGGNPGYTFAWDLDNNGAFGDSTDRTVEQTYTTSGPRTVRVRITDNDQGNFTNTHTAIVTRTFTVADPPPPGSPAPPPPPPCEKQLTFQLSQFTTTGCFRQTGSSPERWDTTAAVKLNGITFPDYGQHFVVTLPSSGEPGGHFSAPNSTMQLGGFTPYSGDIDWSLPAGGQGEEKQFKTFSATLGTKILGLNVLGTIGLRLGFAADGTHYATFPLNIELPGGFKAGPDTDYGRVTGTASLRVDPSGVHYDGLRLRATNVWLGKLKVEETCFSYVPAGGQSVAPCPQPSFDGTGEPFISCRSDVNTDRWDGNAVVKLPSGGSARLGAFGGLANGQVANLGATVGFSGNGVPIAPNVFLTKVEFGLCVTPPPLKIKGTIGVGILPTPAGPTVGVDGSVEYTDGDRWTLQAGGAVSVFGKNLGSGSVTLRAYNGIDFNLQSKVDLYGIASLEGKIDGWVDVPRSLFNIAGSVKACVGGGICAQGSGVVSTNGIAGCVTIVSTISSPDLIITLDPLSARFDDRPLVLTAGFGYRWGASAPDLFANSCDFAPYSLTRSFARAAATGASSPVKIARRTAAVSLRIHGSHGVPKFALRGPRGATITSPSSGHSKQSKGHYLLAENPRNGTTSVILIHPAAGTWRVSAAPGARSLPTAVDRSKAQAPPTFGAKVQRHGAMRTVTMVYAVPKGTSVRLVERAKGIARTIAGSVQGRRCPAGPTMRPGSDQRILCARVRFHPSRGPGGTRQVQALVTRQGMPLSQKDIASFTAPAEALPSRPGALRARRANGYLVVAFPRSTGASRYAVSAVLSDGRELAFYLGSKCRAVRIAAVGAGVSATVKVGGVRYDLQTGAKRSLTIAGDATTAGPKGKLPRRLWKPRLACS